MQTIDSRIQLGRRVRYQGDMANNAGDGLISAIGSDSAGGAKWIDITLFDGRRLTVSPHAFSGLRPIILLDKVHGPELIAVSLRMHAERTAREQTAAIMSQVQFIAAETARTVDVAPVFYWNGIKDAKGAKLQKAWYSDSEIRGMPAGTITIYARDYRRFSNLVAKCFEIQNDTDVMTDYFDSDKIRVVPTHPLYPAVLAAMTKAKARRK